MSCPNRLFLLTLFCLFLPCKVFAVTENCIEARQWLNRGLVLHDGSQKEIQYYKQAVQLCPDLIGAYNRIGEIYRQRGEYELAKQAFATAGTVDKLPPPFFPGKGAIKRRAYLPEARPKSRR